MHGSSRVSASFPYRVVAYVVLMLRNNAPFSLIHPSAQHALQVRVRVVTHVLLPGGHRSMRAGSTKQAQDRLRRQQRSQVREGRAGVVLVIMCVSCTYMIGINQSSALKESAHVVAATCGINSNAYDR